MENNILDLAPSAIWRHFAALCSRPHPSKHEQLIIEYLEEFAKANQIECIKDGVGNIILRKPATEGMEDRKGIIFQAHMDMVPQANSDKEMDFTKDPITPIITPEGWVTADGTTLGADNGIGLAAALAVFEDKTIKHGPIETLFTVDEEAGMTGAFALEPGVLKGDILINLDSETEGELYVGCAGGIDVVASKSYTKESLSGDYKGFEIAVKGLKGGHSGMEIILQRGNACKIVARLCDSLIANFGVKVAKISAGNMRNAIPREGELVIAVEAEKAEAVASHIAEFAMICKNELAATDEGVEITSAPCAASGEVIADADIATFVSAAHATPNGVIRMSDSVEGLVETSLNVGIIEMNDSEITMIMLVRSSVESAKDDLVETLLSIYKLAGMKAGRSGGYSGWNPDMGSPILSTMRAKYNDLYGKQPEIMAIHAGLECGIIGGKYTNLDMISVGPTICYPHSPDEKVNIASVAKFWDFLVAVVEDAPQK